MIQAAGGLSPSSEPYCPHGVTLTDKCRSRVTGKEVMYLLPPVSYQKLRVKAKERENVQRKDNIEETIPIFTFYVYF